MKATITYGTMFTLALLSPLSLHAKEKDGPTIRILSPQEGQTVTETFEVSYTLKEGFNPEYVHVFFDGFYKKEFSSTLTNVPKGPHLNVWGGGGITEVHVTGERKKPVPIINTTGPALIQQFSCGTNTTYSPQAFILLISRHPTVKPFLNRPSPK